MTLEFKYGSVSCQSREEMAAAAYEWLKEDPERKVFYIVPRHITFETEVAILSAFQALTSENQAYFATANIQVYSFERLAWYFLQNTAFYPKNLLSDAGNHMLIRKVLQQKQEELQLFRGEVEKQGFIEQLSELFQEFIRGNIQVEDLATVLKATEKDQENIRKANFQLKIQEFQLLYAAYLEELAERQLGDYQLLANLSHYFMTQDLAKTMFVIADFNYFTAIEEQVLQTIIAKAGKTQFYLITDQVDPNRYPEAHELFFNAKDIYYRFYHYAREQQVAVYTKKLAQRDRLASDLQKLDEYLQQEVKSAPFKEPALENVKVWQGETPYAEVLHIAREIHRLVVEEGYRYQDIEILGRELNQYQDLLLPMLARHKIPYHLNHELAMKHHPFIEFLLSLFDVYQYHYRYRDIMRFLRSEFFMPELPETATLEELTDYYHYYRENIDLTENVLLAYGYEGTDWTKEQDWQYISYDFQEDQVNEDLTLQMEKRSNEVRNQVRTYLVPLFKAWEKAKTGRVAAKALYDFLLTSKADQQFIYLRDQAIAKGNLEEARNHEHTWQAFIDLLDEYVALLGEESFQFDHFSEIFRSGLEKLTYNKIPAVIDQIEISSLESVHHKGSKAVFILGLNDQALPAKVENKTLLSDEERSLIDDSFDPTTQDKFLRNQASHKMLSEAYTAYRAFLAPSEKLYLSYSLNCDWHKETKISPFVAQIVRHFDLPIEHKWNQPLLTKPQEFSTYISTYRMLISDLVSVLRQAKEMNQPLPAFWRSFREKLKRTDWQPLAERVLSSVEFRNTPETLDPKVVQELYGDTIYASVSKIESFYQCEYQYFIRYGLGLKERQTFELSSAETGNFFHEALDRLFKVMIQENFSFTTLNMDEIQHLTQRVLNDVLGDQKFAILNHSNRMKYISHQLAKTIQRVSWALKKQSERTGMSTVQTEVLFGQYAQQTALDTLSFDLGEKRQLKVRGKIDRLDEVHLGDEIYLAVVDYKSSAHKFDFRDAYYGLTMQMITYLDVALQNAVQLVGKPAQPAGAFYLHVRNPLVEGQLSEAEQEKNLLENFRYQGLLVDQPELLAKMDYTVEPQQKSLLYPFKENKSGEKKSAQFVTKEELDQLIEHNRENFKAAGRKIYEGDLAFNPAYRDKQRLACKHCPFRSICQFDVLLPENQYHRLDTISRQGALERIKNRKKGEKSE